MVGQLREALGGVKMQTLVVIASRTGYLILLFEKHEILVRLRQAAGCRQAGGARSDDHGVHAFAHLRVVLGLSLLVGRELEQFESSGAPARHGQEQTILSDLVAHRESLFSRAEGARPAHPQPQLIAELAHKKASYWLARSTPTRSIAIFRLRLASK